MHPMPGRMPPQLSSPSPAPRLHSLSTSDCQPFPSPLGPNAAYGSTPSHSAPTAITSDITATSVPAYPCTVGAPSYTPLGITPAPLQPADSEVIPAATSPQGVFKLTVMAHMNSTLSSAPLALSTMIHLMGRN
ncbi:hypothetical protein L873DRAFT_1881123 [Choiromyces venosus 120613-1]|uniref:Uncharacterized protein n=1 Tax=Choiromyces venosus 120613-1 TaxID=1336337 RepID=A0A3N4K8E0_9PEZI|nr:hypothetical protein L873DRAFT_1881123 [Choiromyces venosus 120613-1]